jgi:hypothetical protein
MALHNMEKRGQRREGDLGAGLIVADSYFHA